MSIAKGSVLTPTALPSTQLSQRIDRTLRIPTQIRPLCQSKLRFVPLPNVDSSSLSSTPVLAAAAIVGTSVSAAVGLWRKRKASRQRRCRWHADKIRISAVPVAELLPPGIAASWPELDVPVEGLQAVAADLSDVDRIMEIVAPVFNVGKKKDGSDDPEEAGSVVKGIQERLGSMRSLLARDADNPKPLIGRPAPLGSTTCTRPDIGLVLGFEPISQSTRSFAALMDLSIWPDDGRVRLPGARSKPGVCGRPYVLNLCVAPEYRRRGLARALMSLSERIARDIWGDDQILLHVEDDKLPANALYENMGYAPMKYTFDQEFPYTKAEADVLRNVTWRRKMLPPPSPTSPIATRTLLPEQEARAALNQQQNEDEYDDDDEEFEGEDDEDFDEEVGQEEKTEVAKKDEEDDFDWVTNLMK
eukprot:TRINITY_DN58655_c0_g1_i1.p1 TRINITY_DN58655_c0_g1~~TRINITY_DN58655_c0_g1_i1.p1  ORF type:complete len:417 (+),score=101.29 TRINITY_DN58655_c0_g1_i1:69-1319(+)